jgi:hypothetical protein
MIRPKVDPFLLNFVTLGIIILLLALMLVQVSQRTEIADRLNKQEQLISKQDTNRLYQVLSEIMRGQNLTKQVLQEQISQLEPPRATEERQIQAEQDHFNQTETILQSIQESGNQTRQQAETLSDKQNETE